MSNDGSAGWLSAWRTGPGHAAGCLHARGGWAPWLAGAEELLTPLGRHTVHASRFNNEHSEVGSTAYKQPTTHRTWAEFAGWGLLECELTGGILHHARWRHGSVCWGGQCLQTHGQQGRASLLQGGRGEGAHAVVHHTLLSTQPQADSSTTAASITMKRGTLGHAPMPCSTSSTPGNARL